MIGLDMKKSFPAPFLARPVVPYDTRNSGLRRTGRSGSDRFAATAGRRTPQSSLGRPPQIKNGDARLPWGPQVARAPASPIRGRTVASALFDAETATELASSAPPYMGRKARKQPASEMTSLSLWASNSLCGRPCHRSRKEDASLGSEITVRRAHGKIIPHLGPNWGCWHTISCKRRRCMAYEIRPELRIQGS
jgi:hypothetical protein